MSNHLFLLDSTVWIHLNRRDPPERLASRAKQLIAADLAAYNQVIRSEILVGCRDDQEYWTNNRQIGALRELPLHQSIWDAAAGLGFALRRRGVTAGLPDLLIAASALEHDAIVVHADTDFDTIASHSDLRVESYAESSA